jgi:hypothetical protein
MLNNKTEVCESSDTCGYHDLKTSNLYCTRGRRGLGRMVAGFTTTHAISGYHHERYMSSNCAQARCTLYNIM